jgi:hypothetical protein
MAVLAAMAVAPAGATSALDRAYGTPRLGTSPRAAGMGGAGSALAQGAFSLVENPAALAGAPGPVASLATSAARVSENRFVPLFDTFDSYVHETAIAVNDHRYADLRGGVAWTAPALRGVVLAAGAWDRYDPRYDYFDERRSTSTSDQIVSERFISTTGTLRALSLGVGAPLGRGLALGAAVHRYDGRIRHRDALVARTAGVSGKVTVERRLLSGVSAALGATTRIGERLRAGVTWESGPRLLDRYAVVVDDVAQTPEGARRHVWLPPRVTMAAAYLPRNSLRTTFAVDAVWTPWSSVTDASRPGVLLRDTWDVRFGLEHVYYQNLPGRIGFRYERSYEQREADRVWLTFGAGWRVARTALDAGIEVGKRDSRQDPVWPRAEQGTAVGAGRDRVEDTVARLTLGAEWSF